MPAHDLFADHDPPTVAALYLSGLDHGHSYSRVELTWAIARTYATVDGPDSLLPVYRRCLSDAGGVGGGREERRAWAFRMAAGLALDEWNATSGWPATQGRALLPAVPEPVCDPVAAEVFRPARALRRLRAARRRPVRVAIALLALYLVNAALANAAPALMAVSLAGPVNIGLALVLAQLSLTSGAVVWYGRYAAAHLDPLAERLGTSFDHQPPERPR